MGRKEFNYALIALLLIPTLAWAGQKVTGNLQVTGLAGSGSRCVQTDASGNITAYSASCSSGITGVNWGQIGGSITAQNWSQANAYLPNQSVNWQSISGYAAGQILTATTSNGVNWGNPVTPTSPALTLVSTTTVTGAADSGNISITSTNKYLVKIVITDTSTDEIFQIRFNNSSSSEYGYVTKGFTLDGTARNSNAGVTTATQINTSVIVGDPIIYINFEFGPQSLTSTLDMPVFGTLATNNMNATAPGYADFMGLWQGSAAATSFKILSSTGTWTGVIKLYLVS